jgi:hypothetical protein
VQRLPWACRRGDCCDSSINRGDCSSVSAGLVASSSSWFAWCGETGNVASVSCTHRKTHTPREHLGWSE